MRDSCPASASRRLTQGCQDGGEHCSQGSTSIRCPRMAIKPSVMSRLEDPWLQPCCWAHLTPALPEPDSLVFPLLLEASGEFLSASPKTQRFWWLTHWQNNPEDWKMDVVITGPRMPSGLSHKDEWASLLWGSDTCLQHTCTPILLTSIRSFNK